MCRGGLGTEEGWTRAGRLLVGGLGRDRVGASPFLQDAEPGRDSRGGKGRANRKMSQSDESAGLLVVVC